jgi:uncharacterized RDD family membrane protein YckC
MPGDPPSQEEPFIGVVTRAIALMLDALLINAVATGAGLAAALILSMFPLENDLHSTFEVIAAVAYVVWIAVYFVASWSISGQTPGARVMRIRLVTTERAKVKPLRGLIRWIGMNLAMMPLFAGYLPILFGRRGFPDWLAGTLVLDAPQLPPLAEAKLERIRTAQSGSGAKVSPGDGRSEALRPAAHE